MRMKRWIGLILCLLATAVVAGACGGGDDDSDGAAPSETVEATASQAADGDGAALADQMVAEYTEMTEAYVTLLEEDLPPDELADEIAALKDEYIAIFVAIGHQREALDEEGVAAFNSRALSGIFGLEFDHHDMVNDTLAELNAAGENDLASEINSLNILTQYAQFELLWDQEPDEAERLALPSPRHER